MNSLLLLGAQLLVLPAALVTLLTIVGYAYMELTLARVADRFIPMALNTSLAFGALCGGILCARPDRGLMSIVCSDAAGGIMSRRLLPAAILIPSLMGWIRLMGRKWVCMTPW